MPPPQSVVVVPDTNVLFTPDKANLPGARLSEASLQWHDVASIEVHLPEIVLWELRTQFAAVAEQLARSVQSKSETLAKVIAEPAMPQVETDRIRPLVEARLNRWVSEENLKIMAVPLTELPWDSIVQRAVWQEAPFSRGDESRSERGFKDCLLLETLKHHLPRLRRIGAVMFVSEDELLRDTVTADLGEGNEVRCFESFDRLTSFLRLQHESSTKQLADKLLEPARVGFHDKANGSGLFFTAKVAEVLIGKFERYFKDPVLSEAQSLFLMEARKRRKSPFDPQWQTLGDPIWNVDPPLFDSLAGSDCLRWRSPVQYFQTYTRKPPTPSSTGSYPYLGSFLKDVLPPAPVDPDLHFLLLRFEVSWTANLTPEVGLTDFRIEDTKMLSGIFEEYPEADEDATGKA